MMKNKKILFHTNLDNKDNIQGMLIIQGKNIHNYMEGKNNHFFTYRLQYFAKDGDGGEKTEEPTGKRLSEARKDGQVAKSGELIMATSLLTLFYTLKFFLGYIGKQFLNSYNKMYSNLDKIAGDDFTNVTAQLLLQDVLLTILKISIPVFISSVVISIVVNISQVKWEVSTRPLRPKFNKFNPVSGFKRLFSKDKIIELLKSVLKIFVIAYICNDTLKEHKDTLFILYDIELDQAIIMIGNIVIELGIDISALFLIIGFADLLYQKIKFKKDMKMTKQEVKDEYKMSEGDPHIKSKIKAKMREVSQRRMMQRLPEADVIITNPTHFAAAIKYDKETAEAPILIAKGADYLAQKIKEVAKENHIEIVENKPLARMLYYNVEIDDEIPPELYQMTAEVLAYVYGLKHKD